MLAVTFGFGFFAAFILWGNGAQGAPALRAQVVQMDDQIRDLKNKQVDVGGKLTVTQGRLDQCLSDLQKAHAAPSGGQTQ